MWGTVGGFGRAMGEHPLPVPGPATAVQPGQFPRAVPPCRLGGFEGCGVAPMLGPPQAISKQTFGAVSVSGEGSLAVLMPSNA